MIASPPDFDSASFRAALGRFATGVAILTTLDSDNNPVGLTISSFNTVSLHPPLVLWSISTDSNHWAVFKNSKRYIINILAADQIELARRFGTKGTQNRFNHLAITDNEHGLPKIDGCCAWFECYNRSQYLEGDHAIMVGEVEHCDRNQYAPLVFHAGGFSLPPDSVTIKS